MKLAVVGLSHRTAPIDLRERFAFSADALAEDLSSFLAMRCVREVLIVSTCNRVEVYAAGADPEVTARHLRRHLCDHRQVALSDAEGHLYEHTGRDACRHMFRVVSSLDSMVLGEPQIQGQVKEAFRRAADARTVGQVIHRCVHRAFSAARRVRKETGIGRESVSISSVAVDLAKRIYADLQGRTVLLVGAGKMGRLAARKLRDEGVGRVLVANRSLRRAEETADEIGGIACDLLRLDSLLVEADIVFTSTGATDYLIRPAMVTQALKARRYRPLFLIDTAVPRNVDPRVHGQANVYLYDTDDLQQVVESHVEDRRHEARAAERIVAEELEAFEAWLRSQAAVPTVVALRERVHGIQEQEVARVLRRLETDSERDRALIEGLGRAIANKVLHRPMTALKRAQARGEDDLETATHALFGLGEEDGPSPERAGSPCKPRRGKH